MKKKRKQRRKYSPAVASIRLLNAVGDWVNANGGNALVVGNIGLMDYTRNPFVADDPYRFMVVVRVTGQRPETPLKKKELKNED